MNIDRPKSFRIFGLFRLFSNLLFPRDRSLVTATPLERANPVANQIDAFLVDRASTDFGHHLFGFCREHAVNKDRLVRFSWDEIESQISRESGRVRILAIAEFARIPLFPGQQEARVSG